MENHLLYNINPNKKYKKLLVENACEFSWGGCLLKSNEGMYKILDRNIFQYF